MVHQFNTSSETLTLTLTGPASPDSLHMWVTQFGWDGMVQTNSSFFQQLPDVAVVNGTVTVSVPVDAIITLSTMETSKQFAHSGAILGSLSLQLDTSSFVSVVSHDSSD